MNQYLDFRALVRSWYVRHGRHGLPWRKTHDPYRILVSEVMLQQTQVSRVVPRYHEFLRAFPSLRVLAAASLRDVLVVWQGLGYNRRARSLRQLARTVTSEYRGRLPHTVAELETLPGIGPYTARAVACLAFGVPVAMVETNIRKVILHQFFPRRRKVPESEVVAVAEEVFDRRRPRTWNLALMDYGAAQFTGAHGNPNRRSASYARQPKFKGSRRFARGRIVATLASQGSLGRATITADLVGRYRLTRVMCVGALASLVADGLIECRAGRYRLAK